MNIRDEIFQISKLILSAQFLESVRKEVRSVLNDRSIVVDGKHAEKVNALGYDTVVISKDTDEKMASVTRRIKANIPDVDVDEIVKGVLGVKHSRRGAKK